MKKLSLVENKVHFDYDIEVSTDLQTTIRRVSTSAFLLKAAVVIATCAAWTVVSSVAILVNKVLMVDVGFKYPTTIACLGLLTTTLLSYLSIICIIPPHERHAVSSNHFFSRILPTGFMMALTFQTGNGAYLYLTVSFVQMLKAFCPVFTMLLLFATRLEKATPRLVASITLISIGVAAASYGELNMSAIGLATMLTSVLAESVRLVMTQHLLVGQALHPLEGLFYIGVACSFCLMMLAVIFELSPFLTTGAYIMVLQHPRKFLAAALAGFGVNCLAILVIKLASSLTLKVLGTVKDAALVTVGVVFLHEVVSTLQMTGYVISLVGFISYNVIKATASTSIRHNENADFARTAVTSSDALKSESRRIQDEKAQ
ncbi:hypothetical protein CEUSTIGMA_g9529.t1 [Chlamydomonas eustigma]|uniref:Sugar phosphate transporter domain-containing protein n=1 Tax=Chlamydomonas eustigma TaxID=1157962 RepID=A0A250XG99_9CHLO|nr:hypothetical protein CEUSTIGMA_g9529.t1 [Chlamydomonas eustigma]|eukprot:GAX82101.1 hypothetical protein CEUSTIGMA_g9529.t1 [Chlamydomonas eustigma]